MRQQTFFQNIRELIARDELEQALQQLRQLLDNTPQLNEVLQQSGRFADIRKQIRLGVVSHAEATLTQNQIRHALLELLDEIGKQQAQKPALGEELDRAVAIVHSKNVVAGSTISAGGSVHIGDKQVTQHAEKIYNIERIENATFITYPDGRKIPRLLTNRPSPPDYFIGRGKDLQAIAEQIQNDTHPLVLVNGEGGIGKTTLAAEYWRRHEAGYKHLAWMFAEQGIGSALLGLAPSLGLQFDPTDKETVQIDKILLAIANLDKPCLLVFDNANEAADLKKHYQRLRSLTNCHILLTSRASKVGEMKTYAIQPLTEAQGIELFRHHYPELTDAELPLLRAILKAVGYNTLVTELLAKNLTVLNKIRRQYTLENLLHDLQGKGLLALKNREVETTYHSDELRSATPAEIIAAMYDLGNLTEDERYLLSNLAVLPADYIPFKDLDSLLGMDTEHLENALDSLQEKGWLDFNAAEKTFKTSPVIQEVTKDQNAHRLLTDCRALVDTLAEGLNEDNRHTDNYRQAAVFARLGRSVIHAIPTPDYDVATLCQNIGNYHRDTGNLSLAMQAYQKMQDIFVALRNAEPDNVDFKDGLAISYERLGSTHSALGKLTEAMRLFKQYNQLSKELHASFPDNVSFKNGLAISYSKLGYTHSALGNLNEALRLFEQYNQLEKELHASFPDNVSFKNGLAISYYKLGEVNNTKGDKAKAKIHFQQAEALWQELVRDAPGIVQFQRFLQQVRRDLAGISAP